MMDDFRVVRDTASESALWTLAHSAFTRLAAAFEDSALRRRVDGLITSTQSWSVEDWVRSVAFALATAGVVNVLLLSIANQYSAPGIPRAAVALAAILAAIVAAAPSGFITAWPSSLIGRTLTTMTRALYKAAE